MKNDLNELQLYFKENFLINNKLKKIGLNKIKEKHKEFFKDFIKYFELEKYQDQLTISYINYLLFIDNNFKNLICPDCSINFKKIKPERTKLASFCKDCLKKPENKKIIEKIKQEKAKEGCKIKYGTEYPFQSQNIQKKVKEYWIENYGVDHNMKVKEIREKIKKTTIQRYGSDNAKRKNYNNLDFFNKEFIEKKFINEKKEFDINAFCEFFNCSKTAAYGAVRRFNIEYIKNQGYSNSEKEIVNFIKEYYQKEIIENSKSIIKPYEFDIYIPEKNLAIEFNGMLWHSYGLKIFSNKHEDLNYQKNRHLLKTKLAEEKNINLLHISENEWLDPIKQDIWKSVILYKLGIMKQRYFARKLIVKEVNNKEAREFLENNHLQGSSSAKIKLGLYDNEELISIMTFAKPRFNKKYEYELIRFASKKYNTCVGCAQKLFKYFINNYQPKSIISYANRRWAFKNKNIYMTLGFNFINESEPNYYYFKLESDLKLYHRVNFQKYKLKNIDSIKDFYEDNLSETEIMFNAGYRRIYDSGNLVYEWQA